MDLPAGLKHRGEYNLQGSPWLRSPGEQIPLSPLSVNCSSPVHDRKHAAEEYDLWGNAPVSQDDLRGQAFHPPRQQTLFRGDGARPPSLRRTHILPFNHPLELPFQVAVKALLLMSATSKRVYPGRCFYADTDVCARLAARSGNGHCASNPDESRGVDGGLSASSQNITTDDLENSVFVEQQAVPPTGRRWALFAVVACDPPTGAVCDSETIIHIDSSCAARPLRRVQLLALVYNSSWARRSGFPKGVRPMRRRREIIPASSDYISPSQDDFERGVISSIDGAQMSDSVRDVLEPFSSDPFFMPNPAEPVPSHIADDGTGRLAALHLPVQKYSLPLAAGGDARVPGMAGGSCANDDDLWSLPGLFNTLAQGAQRMFEVLQEVTQVRHALVDEELLFHAHVVPYLRQDAVLYHGKIFMSHGVYFLVAATDAGGFEGPGYVTSQTRIYLNVDPFGEFNSVEVLPFKQQFKIPPYADGADPALGMHARDRHMGQQQSAAHDCGVFSETTAGPEQVASTNMWETHIKPFFMSLAGRTRPFFKGEVFTVGGINFKVCYAEPSWPLHGAARIGPETEIYCEGTVALSLADAFALALPKDWEAIRSSPAYMQQRLIMEAFPRLPEEARAILSSHSLAPKTWLSKSGESTAEGNRQVHSDVLDTSDHCGKQGIGIQPMADCTDSAEGTVKTGAGFPCITGGKCDETSVANASTVTIPQPLVCGGSTSRGDVRVLEPAEEGRSAGQVHASSFPDSTWRATHDMLSYAEPSGLGRQPAKSPHNVARPVRESVGEKDSPRCSLDPALQDSEFLEASSKQNSTCMRNYHASPVCGRKVMKRISLGCKSNCESGRPPPESARHSPLSNGPPCNEDSQAVCQASEEARTRWLHKDVTAIGTSIMVAAEPYFTVDAPVYKGSQCLGARDNSSSFETLLMPKQADCSAVVNDSKVRNRRIGPEAPVVKEARHLRVSAASDLEAFQGEALHEKQPSPSISSRGSGRTVRSVVSSRGKYPLGGGMQNQRLESLAISNSLPLRAEDDGVCKVVCDPASARSRGAAFL